MKKFQTIGFFLLSAIAIAALLQSCSKEESIDEESIDEELIGITSSFDPAFAKELQARGYIPDASCISAEDVADITKLDVSRTGTGTDDALGKLTSLKGIEYFTSLRTLFCLHNQLTSLDISNNLTLESLYCFSNQLTSLDVSNNFNLWLLECYDNQLTSLDISNNKSLAYLRCYDNPGDGTKFNVAAWFSNNSIPSSYYKEFTTGTWSYNGNMISINYYIPE